MHWLASIGNTTTSNYSVLRISVSLGVTHTSHTWNPVEPHASPPLVSDRLGLVVKVSNNNDCPCIVTVTPDIDPILLRIQGKHMLIGWIEIQDNT